MSVDLDMSRQRPRASRSLLMRGASVSAVALLIASTPAQAQRGAFAAASGYQISSAVTSAAAVGSVPGARPVATPTMQALVARRTAYQQAVQAQATIVASANAAARAAAKAAAQVSTLTANATVDLSNTIIGQSRDANGNDVYYASMGNRLIRLDVQKDQSGTITGATTAADANGNLAVINGTQAGGIVAATPTQVASVDDPTGLKVWQGADAFNQNQGNNVVVNQTESRAILSWNSLNIGSDTTLTFNQQGNSDWVVINRVVGGLGSDGLSEAFSPTYVLGKMVADGTAYVLSRSGILFGATSQVNLHSLVASTLEFGANSTRTNNKTTALTLKERNDDFLQNGILRSDDTTLLSYVAGESHRADPRARADVSVERGGQIISSGGFVILAAPSVAMAGEINPTVDGATGAALVPAAGGQVSLAAGSIVNVVAATGADGSIDPNVRGLLVQAFSDTAANRAIGASALTGTGIVDVSGSINAYQGYISLVAGTPASNSTIDSIVNLSGILTSTTSVSRNGKIALIGRNVNLLTRPLLDSDGALTLSANGLPIFQSATLAITPDDGSDTIPQSASSVAAFKTSEIDIGNYETALLLSFQDGKMLGSVDLPGTTAVATTAELAPAKIDIGAVDLAGFSVAVPDGLVTAMIHAPSGDVNIGGRNGADAGISEITTQNFTRDTSIDVRDGVIIDVSGVAGLDAVTGVDVDADQNQIVISPAKKNELRDTPTYREVQTGNGFTLNGQTLYLDGNASGVREDGTVWVGSPLIEAGSIVDQIGITAKQLMTTGGNVTFTTGRFENTNLLGLTGVVVPHVNVASKATIDISGGWVNHLSGSVRVTRLITADGRKVDITDADPNDIYIGIDGSFTEYLPQLSGARYYSPIYNNASTVVPAYVEGRDAGTVIFNTPTGAPDGILYGQAIAGLRQVSLAQGPTGTSSVSGDTRKVQATGSQLPSGGFLGFYTSLGASIFYGGSHGQGDAGLPTAILSDGADVSLSANAIHITDDLLNRDGVVNSAGLSAVTFQTSGAVVFARGSELALNPGGTFTVEAGGEISFSGSISVPSGSIVAQTYASRYGDLFDPADDMSPTSVSSLVAGGPGWHSMINAADSSAVDEDSATFFDIVVNPGAALSTRGLFTNDTLNNPDGADLLPGENYFGSAYVDGGSILLEVQPHMLASTDAETSGVLDISGSIRLKGAQGPLAGSLLDVSAGGYVTRDGDVSAIGKGGDVTLRNETIYFQLLFSRTGDGGQAGLVDQTSFQVGVDAGATVLPDRINASVEIAETAAIRSFGFEGGGSFTLITPDLADAELLFGAAPDSENFDAASLAAASTVDASRLQAFLDNSGFAALDLTAWKTALFDNVIAGGRDTRTALAQTQMVTIGAGQSLNLTQTILQPILSLAAQNALIATESGTDITTLVAHVGPQSGQADYADYDRLAVDLTLGGFTELDILAGGTLTGAAGAAVTVPKLYSAGTISIRGGSITQRALLPAEYVASLNGAAAFGYFDDPLSTASRSGQKAIGIGQITDDSTPSILEALEEMFGDADAAGQFDALGSITELAASYHGSTTTITDFLAGSNNSRMLYLLGRLGMSEGIVFDATSNTDLSGAFLVNPRQQFLDTQGIGPGGATANLVSGRLVEAGSIAAAGKRAQTSFFTFADSGSPIANSYSAKGSDVVVDISQPVVLGAQPALGIFARTDASGNAPIINLDGFSADEFRTSGSFSGRNIGGVVVNGQIIAAVDADSGASNFGGAAGSISALGGGNLALASISAEGGREGEAGGTLVWFDPVLQQNATSGAAAFDPTSNRVRVDQIVSAGFDQFTAVGVLDTDGDVDMTLGRGFALESQGFDGVVLGGSDRGQQYTTVINPTGGDLSITAPHIRIGSIVQEVANAGTGFSVTGEAAHDVILRAEAADGSGGSFDVVGVVQFGRSAGTVNLSSAGDIRLVGTQPVNYSLQPELSVVASTLTGGILVTGDLNFTAREVYATTGTGNLVGGSISGNNNAVNRPFIIASLGEEATIAFDREAGTTPTTPYAAGTHVQVLANSIVQNGALYAPFGRLDLGSASTQTIAVAAAPTTSLTFGADSITSVSGGTLSIPFGTTVDQTDYFFTPTGLTPLEAPPAAELRLSADAVVVESGATVDLSGGGDLYGYEFSSGTGGSRDILSQFNDDDFSANFVDGVGYQYPDQRQVYAILPIDSPQLAALYDPIYSAGYGSLYGSQAGQTVTLDAVAATASSPGLAAGTYMLLPAKYALLPGAMRIVQNVGSFSPAVGASQTLLDGSMAVGGAYGVAGTDIFGNVRYSFTVSPQSTIRQYSNIITTSATSAFRTLASSTGGTLPRLPNDAARVVIKAGSSLSISSQFDTTAATDAAGNAGRGSEVDISANAVTIVSTAEQGQALPSGSGLALDIGTIEGLNAASLLIGGEREENSDGSTTLFVTASSITVANDAEHPLNAPEVLLVAGAKDPALQSFYVGGGNSGGAIVLADGATVRSTGTLVDDRTTAYQFAYTYAIRRPDLTTVQVTAESNAGAFLRVAQGAERTLSRSAVPTQIASVASYTVGKGKTEQTYTNFFTENGSSTGNVSVGAATLGGTTVQLDGNRLLLSDDITFNATNVALTAYSVALGSGGTGFTGTTLDAAVQQALMAANSLTLRSPNAIFIAGGTQLLDSNDITRRIDLVLDTPGLRAATGAAAVNAVINADDVTLINTSNSPGTCGTTGAPACTGDANTLLLDATGTLTLAGGATQLYGFNGAVGINAAKGIYYQGTGSLDIGQGTLAIVTPFIADLGTGGVPSSDTPHADYSIVARNNVSISAPSGSTLAPQTDLLSPNARFVLEALAGDLQAAPAISITGTDIRATAGIIDITAQSGVTVTGAATLSAPSYSQTFGPESANGDADPDQVTITAGAGTVKLESLNGDLAFVAQGGTPGINVGGTAGTAGTVSLLATQGAVQTTGLSFNALIDAAAPDGGASLLFDAANSSFDLSGFVAAHGAEFTGDIAIRAGLGGLVLNAGQQIVAESVYLTADGALDAANGDSGFVRIAGTIDTHGENGGDITLYGRRGVVLEGGSRLDAHSDGYADVAGSGAAGDFVQDSRVASAGDIILGAGYDGGEAGLITVQSGATINLGVAAARAGTNGYRVIAKTQTDPITNLLVTSYTIVEADKAGTLTLRAPLVSSGDSVNVNFAGTLLGSPRDISLIGYKRFDLGAVAADPLGFTGVTISNGVATLDPGAAGNNFLAAEAEGTLPTFIQSFDISGVNGQLGALTGEANFHERPGVELAYEGDIVLSSAWNLAAGNISDYAGAIAAGDLAISNLSYVPVAENGEFLKNPDGSYVFEPRYEVVAGREGDLLANYVHMLYRTGGTAFGEAAAIDFRAGGTLDIGASISDGFFNFRDQTDQTYLNYQLGGAKLKATTFKLNCGAAGCSNLDDFDVESDKVDTGKVSLTTTVTLLSDSDPLVIGAPYSDSANAASPKSAGGTDYVGDPLGGAEIFPLITTQGGGQRAVSSSDLRLVAGADTVLSADPLHVDRGVAADVVVEGAYTYALTATKSVALLALQGGIETVEESSSASEFLWTNSDFTDFADEFAKAVGAIDPATGEPIDLSGKTVRVSFGNFNNDPTRKAVYDAFVQAAADLGLSDQVADYGTKNAPKIAVSLDTFLKILAQVDYLGQIAPSKPGTSASGSAGASFDNGIVRVSTLVRTGTGGIDIAASRDVDLTNGPALALTRYLDTKQVSENANNAALRNQLMQLGGSAIYTVGHVVVPQRIEIGGISFDPSDYLPESSRITAWEPTYSTPLQADPIYATGGGDIGIRAGRDVRGRYDEWHSLVAPARSLNEPTSLGGDVLSGVQYYVTDADSYGTGDQRWRVGLLGSGSSLDEILDNTSIRVNPNGFTSGVATLGGGDVRIEAGRDVSELTVALDTTLASAKATNGVGIEGLAAMVFGGGNLDISAGRDVTSGHFDVSEGYARIDAGRNIGASTAASEIDALRIRLTDTAVSLTAGNAIRVSSIGALGVVKNDVGASGQYQSTNRDRFNSLGYYTGNSAITAVSSGGFVLTGQDYQAGLPDLIAANIAVGAVRPLPATLDITSFSGDIDLGPLPTMLYPSATGQLSLLAGGTLVQATDSRQWTGLWINFDDGDPSLLPGLFSATTYEGSPSNITAQQDGRTFTTNVVDPTLSDSERRLLHNRIITHANDPTPARIAVGGSLTNLTLYSPKQTRISAAEDIVNLVFFGQNTSAEDTTRIVAGRDIVRDTLSYLPISGQADLAGKSIILGNYISLGGAGNLFVEAGRNLGPFLNSATITTTDGSFDYAGGILTVGNDFNPWLDSVGANIYAFFGVGNGMNYSGLDQEYIVSYLGAPITALGSLDGDLFEQNEDQFGNKTPDLSRPVYGPILLQWMQANEAGILTALYGTTDVTVTQAYEAFEGIAQQARGLSGLDVPVFDRRRFLLDEVYFNELSQPANVDGNSFGQYLRSYKAVNSLFPSTYGYTANDLSGDSNGGTRVNTGNLDVRLSTIETVRGGDITILGPGGNATVGSITRSSQLVQNYVYYPTLFNIGSLFGRPDNDDTRFAPTVVRIDDLPVGYEGIITLRGGSIRSFTDGDFRLNQSRVLTQQGGDIFLWSSNGDLNAGQGAKSVASVPPVVLLFNPNGGSEIDSAGSVVGAGIAGSRSLERFDAGLGRFVLTNAIADPDSISAEAILSLAFAQVSGTLGDESSTIEVALDSLPTNLQAAFADAASRTATVVTDAKGKKGLQITVGGTLYRRTTADIVLLAPAGTIDLGDAGVRASGNIVALAASFANADNAKAGGSTVGLPSVSSTPAVALPSSAAAALVANVAKVGTSDNANQRSRITVDLLGFYSVGIEDSCLDSNGNPIPNCP